MEAFVGACHPLALKAKGPIQTVALTIVADTMPIATLRAFVHGAIKASEARAALAGAVAQACALAVAVVEAHSVRTVSAWTTPSWPALAGGILNAIAVVGALVDALCHAAVHPPPTGGADTLALHTLTVVIASIFALTWAQWVAAVSANPPGKADTLAVLARAVGGAAAVFGAGELRAAHACPALLTEAGAIAADAMR